MKNILIYLSLFPCLLFGQSELFLSDAISVSEAGTGSRAPRIALLDGNRPIVYWGKTGSNPVLYLAIWDNGNFGEPIALNTNGIEPDLWGGGLGPQIAAQDNLIFLVFENYGQGIYCIKSGDGGQNFDIPVTVFQAPPGRVATLPSIAVDPQGNPIVSFVTTNNSEEDAQYEITKSIDGGLTFPPTTIANTAASGGEVCECCPAAIGIVSEEEMYLGFRNNDNNKRDIWVAKSSDAGANFTEATDIDDTDWITQVCPQSGPDMLISGDSIFSVFYSGGNGANIYFSSLNKENMTSGYQYQFPTLDSEEHNQNYPSIAGSNDTLGVVWQEVGASAGWDIILAWSANGSADLLNNYMVIDNGAFSQKQVDMVYQDGLFHIVYEDQITTQVQYRIAGFQELVDVTTIERSDFDVAISPNPFSERTTVSFENSSSEKISATLYYLNGQILKAYETNGSALEIDDLEAGIYLLKIQKGVEVAIEKLIVK